MKTVRIYTILIAVLIAVLFCTNCAFAFQSSTPEGALEEMATADTLDTVTKHLPLSVQEAIDKLGAKEKEQIAKKLLFRNLMASQGLTLRKKDDGSAWEVINEKHQLEGSIKLSKSFISGNEAMLMLEATEIKSSDSNGEPAPDHNQERTRQRMLVSMRLQEGEWRVMEVGPWTPKSLEAGDFLGRLGQGTNGDAAAEATLRILNSILETYKTTYPEVGFPENLQSLAGPDGAQVSAQHAMMLDPSFMASPLIKGGYQFQYTLVDSGAGKDNKGRYRITATPVEFSKNGARSLFTDETGVIRATTDQRDANENDNPVGESQNDDD